jgi:glutamate racemase
MEHPIKTISDKILKNMEEKDFRKVKSYIGVVETSCTIVEEAYKRINKAATNAEKKDTAIHLVEPVMKRLKEKNLITDELETLIHSQLSRNGVDEVVDDVVLGWKDRAEQVKNACLFIEKIIRLFDKKETRLHNVKH